MIPPDENRLVSEHFTVRELRCPRTKRCLMSGEFMNVLEKTRALYGKPIPISSGYRSKEYNEDLGGASDSQHIYGRAVDVPILSGHERYLLIRAAIEAGMRGIGIYDKHVHLDYRVSNIQTIWIGQSK